MPLWTGRYPRKRTTPFASASGRPSSSYLLRQASLLLNRFVHITPFIYLSTEIVLLFINNTIDEQQLWCSSSSGGKTAPLCILHSHRAAILCLKHRVTILVLQVNDGEESVSLRTPDELPAAAFQPNLLDLAIWVTGWLPSFTVQCTQQIRMSEISNSSMGFIYHWKILLSFDSSKHTVRLFEKNFLRGRDSLREEHHLCICTEVLPVRGRSGDDGVEVSNALEATRTRRFDQSSWTAAVSCDRSDR